MTEENTTKTDMMRGKLECFSIVKQKNQHFCPFMVLWYVLSSNIYIFILTPSKHTYTRSASCVSEESPIRQFSDTHLQFKLSF